MPFLRPGEDLRPDAGRLVGDGLHPHAAVGPELDGRHGARVDDAAARRLRRHLRVRDAARVDRARLQHEVDELGAAAPGPAPAFALSSRSLPIGTTSSPCMKRVGRRRWSAGPRSRSCRRSRPPRRALAERGDDAVRAAVDPRRPRGGRRVGRRSRATRRCAPAAPPTTVGAASPGAQVTHAAGGEHEGRVRLLVGDAADGGAGEAHAVRCCCCPASRSAAPSPACSGRAGRSPGRAGPSTRRRRPSRWSRRPATAARTCRSRAAGRSRSSPGSRLPVIWNAGSSALLERVERAAAVAGPQRCRGRRRYRGRDPRRHQRREHVRRPRRHERRWRDVARRQERRDVGTRRRPRCSGAAGR